MKDLTFEKLPEAVTMLLNEVSELKRLLAEKQEQPHTDQPDKFLTVDELAKILHLSKMTIYSKVSRGDLPYTKRGKRLLFSQKSIYEFLKQNEVLPDDEVKKLNDTYLNKKGANNGK